MDTSVQKRAAARTQELPGAELTHPFGEGWEVWKVRGKVFMLQAQVAGEPLAILKSAPDDARALREAYEAITPGYPMNKKHWITLARGGGLATGLVDDLVTESYPLVVENLLRPERPVNPDTSGSSR